MVIRIIKNDRGFITGFVSHINKPWLWPEQYLRRIPDTDYELLKLFLTGKDYVVESSDNPDVTIGELSLKNLGDNVEKHARIQKKVIEAEALQTTCTIYS